VIREIDPHDDADFAGWYDAYLAADSAGRDHPTTWTAPEARESLRRADRANRRLALAAYDGDGRAVGHGVVILPLLDNLHLAYVELGVRPEHRRRGVGTALGGEILDRVTAEGRRVAVAEVVYPLEDFADHPGRVFAARQGFAEASTEVHRVLDLPVDERRIDEQVAQLSAHHAGYRLLSWRDRCPDAWVEAFAEMESAFLTETPLGDLEIEAELHDVQRVRDDEEMRLAQGRSTHVTVAVSPDGTMVGNTVLVVPRHDPGSVYQWGTLVAPAHRGHRLGLALKLTNLRAVQRAHPGARVVHTWNADSNAPMVAVNEQLGFRPVERMGEWQRDLRTAGRGARTS
jgi:GNAT superfamily N-acetyltransferase